MMKGYFLILILITYTISIETEIKLDVNSQTQSRLDQALKNLVDQLQKFSTPKQSALYLQLRVDETAKCLLIMRQQLSQYNNVIVGQSNDINGSENIVVGNYNSVTGVDNFVFIDNFKGQINGSLILGRWKIQLDKKQFIRIHPSWVIFFLNQQQNKKYQKYLKKNHQWGNGSEGMSKGSISLFKQIKQELKSQLIKGFMNVSLPASVFNGEVLLSSSDVPLLSISDMNEMIGNGNNGNNNGNNGNGNNGKNNNNNNPNNNNPNNINNNKPLNFFPNSTSTILVLPSTPITSTTQNNTNIINSNNTINIINNNSSSMSNIINSSSISNMTNIINSNSSTTTTYNNNNINNNNIVFPPLPIINTNNNNNFITSILSPQQQQGSIQFPTLNIPNIQIQNNLPNNNIFNNFNNINNNNFNSNNLGLNNIWTLPLPTTNTINNPNPVVNINNYPQSTTIIKDTTKVIQNSVIIGPINNTNTNNKLNATNNNSSIIINNNSSNIKNSSTVINSTIPTNSSIITPIIKNITTPIQPQESNKKTTTNNLRKEQNNKTQQQSSTPFNPVNAQLRNDLGPKYIRPNQLIIPTQINQLTNSQLSNTLGFNTGFNLFSNGFPMSSFFN